MSDEGMRELLSQGLDLCVRARKLEEITHDAIYNRGGETRSLTIPLWVEEQYQRDLADWEARTRKALSAPTPSEPPQSPV